MITRLPFAVLLLLSTPGAQAPTHISPARAARGVSGYGDVIFNPLQSPRGSVIQQVHDAGSFHNPGPSTVQRLRFRVATPNTAGFPCDVEIFMAKGATSSLGVSTMFANNIVPGSEVSVFTRKVVNLPTVPDHSWAVMFPFDQSFQHVANAPLTWRMLVRSTTTGPHGYALDWWYAIGGSTRTGMYPGCWRAMHVLSHVPPPGGTAVFQVFGYATGGLLAVGLKATHVDLGPLGAPGCALVNDWVWLLPAQPRPGFTLEARVSIPADASLVNQVFFSQFLLFTSVNPLGVITADGWTSTIPPLLGVTQIANYGDSLATSGDKMTPQSGVAIALN